MKRCLLVLVWMMLVIVLTACSDSDITTGQDSSGNNEVNTEQTSTNENAAGTGNVSGGGNIHYCNDNLGFSMEFPASWDGYYKIIEDKNLVNINFIGKSEASKGEDGQGLLMFLIGRDIDPTFLDSVKKIRAINNVDYYYATASDFPLAHLVPEKEANIEKAERILIDEDWQKAQEMQKDIESIVASFEVNRK